MLSVESKRQRRPNVRLGEIGDASAAFSCGGSHKIKNDIHWEKRWDYGFLNPEESDYNYFSGFCQDRSSEFDFSDAAVFPWLMVDADQNRENENPNSMNFVSEFDTLDDIEMIKSELDYGTLANNCMPVKGRRSKRSRRTDFGGYWSSEVISPVNTEDEKGEYQGKEVMEFASNTRLDTSAAYGFNATLNLDHGASAMSKEVCEDDVEIDEPTFKSLSSESFSKHDVLEDCHGGIDSVGRWLEVLGFGNYAGLFEMHEVDEEALPLLTPEDLKEIGVVAVGHRRKLYTAIQQLRNSNGQ